MMRIRPRREDDPMASPEQAAVQSVRPRTTSKSGSVPIIIGVPAGLWRPDLGVGGDAVPVWEIGLIWSIPWYHNAVPFKYFLAI